MNNFTDKKIGIWGFGVVGKSALTYFDQLPVAKIDILDKKEITLPKAVHHVTAHVQSNRSIQQFLHDNDLIVVSPGIPLHDYQDFRDKFISELDLYQAHTTWSTIAITGSLGKTSITHLLTLILQKMDIHACAAGNIGYAMLNLISNPQNACDTIVLELSSFQLQQSKNFAPDLAIITNLYENHLDHHTNMQEYFLAKAQIFLHQNTNQQALLPLYLLPEISTIHPIQPGWIFFSPKKIELQESISYHGATMYYLNDRKIYKIIDNQIHVIFDLAHLPDITFDENWLIIIAALDTRHLPLQHLANIAQKLEIPDHRLQKIGSWHESHFYNDSKSTVWQATLQAVESIEKQSNVPIKLFVGGLSKGADRTQLFENLQYKNIEVFAFGHEAQSIKNICKTLKIPCQAHSNLDESWQACLTSITTPSNILFSPGGSSFDLFTDYKARGQKFVQLFENLS